MRKFIKTPPIADWRYQKIDDLRFDYVHNPVQFCANKHNLSKSIINRLAEINNWEKQPKSKFIKIKPVADWTDAKLTNLMNDYIKNTVSFCVNKYELSITYIRQLTNLNSWERPPKNLKSKEKTKICKQCIDKTPKPVSSFYRTKDAYQDICRDCTKKNRPKKQIHDFNPIIHTQQQQYY